MIDDKTLLQISKNIAKRYIPHARHLGPPSETFSELTNVAFCAGKPHPFKPLAIKWMTWTVLHYISTPNEQLRKRFRAKDHGKDLRRGLMYYRHEPTPLENLLQSELLDSLISAMRILSSEDLELINLYFQKNLTHVEIGNLKGFSRETSRMKLKTIIEILKERLK